MPRKRTPAFPRLPAAPFDPAWVGRTATEAGSGHKMTCVAYEPDRTDGFPVIFRLETVYGAVEAYVPASLQYATNLFANADKLETVG